MFPLRRLFTLPLPGGRQLRLGERPLVMGIVNVTPDSFAEGGSRLDPERAIDAALRMEDDGADMLDVGGESTRPGADPLAADEELRRVLPVLRGLAGRSRVPVSIDTYKADVARAAIEAGASLVNDVSGLRFDPGLAGVVAAGGAALIVMHTRGRPKQMYGEAVYADLVTEVAAELTASVHRAVEAGVSLDRIVVDPGVGFAKRAEHSYGVLAQLPEIVAAIGRPVLVGPSRKSFMQLAVGNREPVDRDWGTAAAVAAAVLAGAHILRVHAVKEMTQVVKVTEEVRRHGPVVGR